MFFDGTIYAEIYNCVHNATFSGILDIRVLTINQNSNELNY